MSIIAIANISNGVNTIGFRLLDTDTKEIKDVPIDSILHVLSSGTVQIDNLGVSGGKVIGTNGSIDRLTKIVKGRVVGNAPLVIINQIGDQGYTVTDFKGCILTLRNEDVIKYSKQQGIANGKVVEKDGKQFISSINGEYKKIIINDTDKPTIEQIERANLKLQTLGQPYRITEAAGIEVLDKDITSIKILDLVLKISAHAFSGCDKLTHVELPSRLRVIGDKAFKGCSSLETIDIPLTVCRIGFGAFYGCTSLKEISLPISLRVIDTMAFAECHSLATVNTSINIERIGDSAFKNCKSLRSIVLPSGITYLGEDVFSGCSSLKEVTTTRAMFFHKSISSLRAKIKTY